MNKSISMQHGAASLHTTHILDPYLWQGSDPTCAIKVQQAILRAFGIDEPIDKLVEIASRNGWYDGGTPIDAIGSLDQLYGIGVHTMSNATIDDICEELDAGHLVGAVIDANELWKNGIDLKLEHAKDIFFPENPNHAIIINGINPDENSITLSDSAFGDFRIDYPLDKFMDAFHDSENFICATDNPVYFEYIGNGIMQLTDEGLVKHAGPSFILADFNKSEYMEMQHLDSPINAHLVAMPENEYKDVMHFPDCISVASSQDINDNSIEIVMADHIDIPEDSSPFDMNDVYPDIYWGM